MASYLDLAYGYAAPLLQRADAWVAELAADPQTHPYVLWMISLDWWQWVIGVGALFAVILGTKRVLRWPVFFAISLFLALELAAYFTIRYAVFLLERFIFRAHHRSVQHLRDGMEAAQSYEEWATLATQADSQLGCDSWKSQPQSRYFNHAMLENLLAQLRDARSHGDNARLTATLQLCLHKNPAGILNEHLYSKSLVGTKFIVDEFISEVIDSIEYLKELGLDAARAQTRGRARSPAGRANGRRSSKSPAKRRRSTSRAGRRGASAQTGTTTSTFVPDTNSPAEMLKFFAACKRQYGCTALCLSGGASLGNFHWGHVLALLEEGLLPRVLSGTSSGAVVAAVICTRTDEEIFAQVTPASLGAELNSFEESWWTCGWRFWKKRVLYDQPTWLHKLQWFANSQVTPRMTFLEAYQRTGRVLNITCTSQRKHNPAMLLNYITTPNVCIDTAILASAAVPGFIEPVVLMEKINGRIRPYHDSDLQWCDGSLQRDLPLAELSEQFGANFFIVAQCNPHIIPFFFNSRGQGGTPSSWRRRTGGYRGGFLLSALELFLKEDMRKNMKVLSELDLVPSLLGSDFSFLFLQEYQGHITLVPNASLRDYAKIICDPTVPDLERFLHEGRLTAWRKFSMIRNRVLIGNTISRCIRELSAMMPDGEGPVSGAAHAVHTVARSRDLILEQDTSFATM